jgi:PAS domain S-box-containing protein
MDLKENPITLTAGMMIAAVAILGSAKKIWKFCKWVFNTISLRLNAIPNLAASLDKLAIALTAQEARFNITDEAVRNVHNKAILAHAQGVMILEQSPTPMWHCELPSGACTWVNDALCKAFGMSREDAMTWGWTKSLHPDDTKKTISDFMDSVTTGRPYRARYRVLDTEGNPTTYEATGEIIHGVSGNPIAIFGKSIPLKFHT